MVYLITLVLLVGLDLLWFGFVAKGFYTSELSFLMKDSFNWIALGILYLIYTAGLVHFAIRPAISVHQALYKGFFLGLIAYGTFNLTNQAVMLDWPFMVTLLDMSWGSISSGIVASLTKIILEKVKT